MSRQWDRTPRVRRSSYQLRPYIGESLPLDERDLTFFNDVCEIDNVVASNTMSVDRHSQRYVLPIRGPLGAIRGHVLRVPWKNAPRSAVWRSYPKADTYMSEAEPVQSFYKDSCRNGPNPLIMVEDQLSAIKLSAWGYRSVAVLGTPYSADPYGFQQADRVAELAREAGEHGIVVALDADATTEAFKFAQKWGAAFKHIRVAILEKDIKDTPASDFRSVLGV